MSTNRRVMPVSPDRVWQALASGRQYADWVVGTRHIRDVDTGFPMVGTVLHYSVGRWPLEHRGTTRVVDADPGRCLELEVRAWPGTGIRVLFRIAEIASGRTEVTITEHPNRGPAAWVHNPLADLLLKARNVEVLRRLERAARRQGASVGV